MQAFYHSIDTFGAVDGRGIRYVLFLSGCRLECNFCHNPDTWEQGSKSISVEAVINSVNRYRLFYDAAAGGITVSGGEPLLQADFVAELFKRCHDEKIHTTLDTAGYAPSSALEKVIPYCDAILFSLKAASNDIHKKLTGKGNDIILNNLFLAASLSNVTVRYVIIPGINNSRTDILALADIINNIPSRPPVELLPYHTLGRSKWERLGKIYQLSNVPAASENDILQVREWLTEFNITTL